MQRLLITLMVLGTVLLGGMFILTSSMTVARTDPELLTQQFTRIHSSQLRLERELHTLSERLEQLTQEQHSANQQQQPALLAPAEQAIDANNASARHLRKDAAVAVKPSGAGAGAAAECPGHTPFHGLMTSQSSPYQQWQARIMYYHWKKQAAAAGPCGEMGGFTRLCATEGGKPDGLQDEIPTVFVSQVSSCWLGRIGLGRTAPEGGHRWGALHLTLSRLATSLCAGEGWVLGPAVTRRPTIPDPAHGPPSR